MNEKTLKDIDKQSFKLQIKKDLKELADKKYQEFHSRLCPGTNNILGVRVPILRKYAKDFSKKFPSLSYKDLDNEFYEEIMLQGMLIGLLTKNDAEENKEALNWFIPKIDNWAVCDICISGLKFISKDLEVYWDFIKGYANREKEFEKRFGYVVMLNYYLKDEYIDEVLELLVNETCEDYYVYMAVAWALSVALVKYYDKTLNAMINSNLNRITYNKAIQKACESYRITKEQKEELKKLKR